MNTKRIIAVVVLAVAVVAAWDIHGQISRAELFEGYLEGFNPGRSPEPPWGSTATAQGVTEYGTVPGDRVVVISNHGKVSVRGADCEGVSGTYSLTVEAGESPKDLAQRYLEQLSVEVYPGSSGELVIEFAEPPVRARGVGAVEAVLEITVPRRVSVAVDSFSEVTVEDIDGDVKTSGTGSATVRRIGGDAYVSTVLGPIEVADVSGSARVEQLGTISGSRMTVSDVRGDVELRGVGPACAVDRVGGNLGLDTGGGEYQIAGVDGGVSGTCHFSTVRLYQVVGPIEIDATGGTVSVVGLRGPFSGAGKMAFFKLELAPGAGFTVDAITREGSVTGDYPLETTTAGSAGEFQTRGVIGDGTHELRLNLFAGSAEIRRAAQ